MLIEKMNVTNIVFTSFILAILLFVFTFRKKIRFYVKFAIYLLFMFVVATISIFFWVLLPSSHIFLALLHLLQYLLGITLEIEGQDHLTNQESFIIVANHQSALDLLVANLCLSFCKDIVGIFKKDLKWAGPFGIACWLRGCIFIDRKYNKETKIILDQALQKIKENKKKLWIFPEGTRRNTGEIHAFKKGAFHLAIQARLPIVPVVCSQLNFLNVKSKKFDNGVMRIKVLPPIETDNYTADNIEELMENVRKSMINTFNELNKTIKN